MIFEITVEMIERLSLQFQCQLSMIWGLLSVLFLKWIFFIIYLYPVALRAFPWDFTLKGLS